MQFQQLNVWGMSLRSPVSTSRLLLFLFFCFSAVSQSSFIHSRVWLLLDGNVWHSCCIGFHCGTAERNVSWTCESHKVFLSYSRTQTSSQSPPLRAPRQWSLSTGSPSIYLQAARQSRANNGLNNSFLCVSPAHGSCVVTEIIDNNRIFCFNWSKSSSWTQKHS